MHDRALADAILHRTGIVATTPALALPVALCALGVSRIALIGPHDRGYNLRAARGLAEADLAKDYRSQVDPRLNYEQALELAMRIATNARSG